MLVIVSIGSACQQISIAENNEAEWYCEAFRPITWSDSDSKETIEQIIQHNAVWSGLCVS